jgi:hypothetical protein
LLRGKDVDARDKRGQDSVGWDALQPSFNMPKINEATTVPSRLIHSD